MKISEYNEKVNELIKKVAEGENSAINGLLISEDAEIGMNVMNINGAPSLVFCKVDKEGLPTDLIYCLSFKDINSAKRLQIWSNNITTILHQIQINNEDINTLVTGKPETTEKE